MQNNDKEVLLRGGNWIVQLLATMSCCLSIVTLGACAAWSSPAIEYLESNETTIYVTKTELGTVTSIMSIGSIIGYLTVPIFMDHIGRKFSMLLYAIPQIISFILIIFAENIITLYGARILAGIGTGACVSLVSVYIGEITDKKVRGMLGLFQIISADVGILATASMATYLPYQTMNKILLSFPIIFFVTFSFMPESPYFYLMRGRGEAAAKSLMRLRGMKNRELVEPEIERIKKGLEEDKSSGGINLIKLFSKASNRRGFLVIMCAQLTSVFSGSVAMVAYAQQIFKDSGSALSPGNSYMILGVVKIFTGLAVSQLVERAGRRLLFLSSGIASATALATVAFYFLCRDYLELKVSFISWLPLIGLITYDVSAASGLSPIPLILLGEIFPISVKKSAVTCTFVISSFAAFITEQIFLVIRDNGGIYASFFMYSICCFFGAIFSFRIMPETKGKTLEELQTILNSR